MALVLPCDTRETVSIEDYLERIRALDLRDQDKLAESAPLLRALANDRTLVVRQLNKEIENSFGASYIPSAQTVYLGGGEDFYVRAAVWPSTSAVAGGLLYQDRFAYHVAHDHNFSFLTVNYLGPGYETELYEYDYERVAGHIGEPVDLRFVEKVRFGPGTVMFYRASRDVHIQFPPQELTITLNLMISPPELRSRDQFYFDTARKIISGYPTETDPSRRVSLVKLAGYVGNEETRALLTEVATGHPCRRTRLSALEALCVQEPARSLEIWERACSDPAPLVVQVAQQKLKTLEAA
jgi:hypothetical protein